MLRFLQLSSIFAVCYAGTISHGDFGGGGGFKGLPSSGNYGSYGEASLGSFTGGASHGVHSSGSGLFVPVAGGGGYGGGVDSHGGFSAGSFGQGFGHGGDESAISHGYGTSSNGGFGEHNANLGGGGDYHGGISVVGGAGSSTHHGTSFDLTGGHASGGLFGGTIISREKLGGKTDGHGYGGNLAAVSEGTEDFGGYGGHSIGGIGGNQQAGLGAYGKIGNTYSNVLPSSFKGGSSPFGSPHY